MNSLPMQHLHSRTIHNGFLFLKNVWGSFIFHCTVFNLLWRFLVHVIKQSRNKEWVNPLIQWLIRNINFVSNIINSWSRMNPYLDRLHFSWLGQASNCAATHQVMPEFFCVFRQRPNTSFVYICCNTQSFF